MSHAFDQYFRCPEQYASFSVIGPLAEESSYFTLGDDILFGRVNGRNTAKADHGGEDVSSKCIIEAESVWLPFDPSQVADSLRLEKYANTSENGHPASSLLGRSYYFLRPLLPIKFRRHLQRLRLNGWRQIRFPKWPVDRTVDNVMEKLLLLSLRRNRCEIPFIWFWPDGASSCAVMTHDVETSIGRDFCPTLMDLDDQYGVKASFQVVPESRYGVSDNYLANIRDRCFEINVQDLNHDGHLFRDRKEFLARAARINQYGRQFGAEGFRSAVLYRRQEWYDALEFAYDMSVPSVAHLDPQRGGCCTVMPYFVGNMVELPVTITQDYTLFHILEDHSIDLWKQQSELVMEKHGLMNFIIHPDYIIANEERATFESLLAYLADLRARKNLWMPLPRQVASWWRQRSKMRLVKVNGTWQIEGEGKERARVAYASENHGQIIYSFESAVATNDAIAVASPA